MKKTVSIMLCLLLIFSSVNYAFADFTSADSTNLSNLTSYTNTIKNALTSSNGTIYYAVTQINAAMRFNNKTLANWLADIYNGFNNYLSQSDGDTNQTIAWWVKEAVLDLEQLAGSGSGTMLYYLNMINTRAGYINNNLSTVNTNLGTINTSVTNLASDVDTISVNSGYIRSNLASLIEDYMVPIRSAITTYLPSIKTDTDSINTTITSTNTTDWPAWTSTLTPNNGISTFSRTANPLVQAVNGLQFLCRNVVYGFTKTFYQAFTGYDTQQNATNWLTLQNSTFTPTSQTNGLYSWLSYIQTPIARLAYVHASNEEIAAREKAAANQDAVVDNFIDSNGSGAAPASSFGSVASMSSGYTSNMNTDAQASGIWNIFNSNNFGWFSQETANQLDTTVSTRKGSSDFETPLLDQQIADIYKELGVDVND